MPGEIISIFGVALGPDKPAGARLDDSGKIATTISGFRVLIGGTPAPLLYVSKNQFNAVVPFGIGGQSSALIEVEEALGPVTSISVPVADVAPGVFYSSNFIDEGHAAVLNEDGTVNSQENPATRGSIISLFVTGLGQMNPSASDGAIPIRPEARPAIPVRVDFRGPPPTASGLQGTFPPDAEITYIGDAPGLVEGIVQINARLPTALYSSGSARLQPIYISAQGNSGVVYAPPTLVWVL